jgi:hypothetical protein
LSAAPTIAEPASWAEGADPHRHQAAVAITIADQLGIDAELFRQDLLEGRGMALAVIHAAGQQHDAARRVKADLGMLVIAPARGGNGGGNANAEQLATCSRCGRAFGYLLVVAQRQTVIEVFDEVAAVVCLLHRRLVGHCAGREGVAAAQFGRGVVVDAVSASHLCQAREAIEPQPSAVETGDPPSLTAKFPET